MSWPSESLGDGKSSKGIFPCSNYFTTCVALNFLLSSSGVTVCEQKIWQMKESRKKNYLLVACEIG